MAVATDEDGKINVLPSNQDLFILFYNKVVDKVGFAPVPAGPKAHNCATFIEGMGIPATAKNKKAAWLWLQWICGKQQMGEVLRAGSGTPARLSVYGRDDLVPSSTFPRNGSRPRAQA